MIDSEYLHGDLGMKEPDSESNEQFSTCRVLHNIFWRIFDWFVACNISLNPAVIVQMVSRILYLRSYKYRRYDVVYCANIVIKMKRLVFADDG